jgi:2-iminobutanoate/2-iminopropanoate deaminase
MSHSIWAGLLMFVLACCSSPPTRMITSISALGAPAAIGPYSHGMECHGSLVFLSGQIALRADGTFVDGSVEEQTRIALSNVATILASQGLEAEHVVKSTIFLQSMDDFAAVNGVYAEFFGAHRPARSTVAVAALPKNAKVEIEVVACRPLP